MSLSKPIRDAHEAKAAAECREYHERFVRPQRIGERRHAVAEFGERFYVERLRTSLAPAQREAFRSLADADHLAVEIAHDGQLPHLGIVRMVLKADAIAREDGRAVVLYLIGNHYTPEMRPDNIHYGMPLKGQPPNAVKHPPKIPIGRANLHTPFRLLPPPSAEDLDGLRRQLEDYVGHNVGYEQRVGLTVPDDAKEVLLSRLRSQFDLLARAAHEVGNFGDWMIRVQRDLFTEMLGDRVAGVLFLPMAELTDLFRKELATVAQKESKSRFWLHCPECNRRARLGWTPGTPVEFACAVCHHRATIPPEDVWQWLMPDIVAYESGLFRLGIDGWVVGSRAEYHPEIERVYSECFGVPMPPKFVLPGVPRFRGVGDEPKGYGRTRLLRALLEVEPASLARALAGPWEEDPHITSPFLPRADS